MTTSRLLRRLPPPEHWMIRSIQGLGSCLYGIVGVSGIIAWPLSIMMFDDPNWTQKQPVMLPVLWLGFIGFGPIGLFSSYQLGVAARYGYYANSFDASFPLLYGTIYSCIAVTNEQITKYQEQKHQSNREQDRT